MSRTTFRFATCSYSIWLRKIWGWPPTCQQDRGKGWLSKRFAETPKAQCPSTVFYKASRGIQEFQAAEKLCGWRHDDMMTASQKWRGTSLKVCGMLEEGTRKAQGPLQVMLSCHMRYRLKQQSMMSVTIPEKDPQDCCSLVERVQQENLLCGRRIARGRARKSRVMQHLKIAGRSRPRKGSRKGVLRHQEFERNKECSLCGTCSSSVSKNVVLFMLGRFFLHARADLLCLGT